MLWTSISSSAYDFEVDGFYYEVNIEKMTATLVAGENKHSGEVVVPEYVTYKDRQFSVNAIEGAFSNNTELTSVIIPSSVKFLGKSSFEGCSSLKSISGLDNVTEIGESCFSGCEALVSIELSSALKNIRRKAFMGCGALNNVIVPESVDSIGAETFQDCSSLSSIKLPETIVFLSNGLFKNCNSLVKVDIPSSISIVEDEVFSGCKSLESLIIPSNVLEIRNHVFDGCENLGNVKFEDCVEPIILGHGKLTKNNRVFGLFYDSPVNSLYLGRDLSYPQDETIFLDGHYEGYTPFQSCNINEVTISEFVSKIDPYTFYNCINLGEVIIPTSVTSIGVYAFARSGVRTFTINDGLKNISLGVTENDDLTTIFLGCNNLKNIKIGRNCVVSDKKSTGWVVANDLKIPSLFPPTIENIEVGNYVDELSWLQLYNGCIAESLEHYPNIKLLKLGCCIGYIPCLANNKQLENLVISSIVPVSLSTDAFSNSQYMDLVITVPAGCEGKYKETEVWNKFWNISTLDNLLSNVVVYENQLYGFIEGNNIGLLKTPYGLEGKVTIPQNIDYNGNIYKIITIGKVFKNNLLIKEVDIKACIEKLDADCFKGCSELETINLSDGLIQISAGAFYDCISLSNLTIPNTVESIGEYSFYNCQSFKTLSIPSSIVSFGVHAFDKCKINSLVFEDGEVALDFPNGPSSIITIFDRGMSQSEYLSTSEGYFWDTSIKWLYIGRNLNDHVIESEGSYYSGITYYRYDDPFYSIKDLETLIIGSNVNRIGSDSYMEEPKDPSYPYNTCLLYTSPRTRYSTR